jgi:hypothetical protein
VKSKVIHSGMKQLTLRLAPPLTIISMFLVTKWWFALPVDAPDKLYWGFPFPFLGQGFHTSMSFQFFVLEFVADFIVYFLGWVGLLYLIFKNISIAKVSNYILTSIWSVAMLLSIGFIILLSTSNPVIHLKRDYDWKILQTGHVYIWQDTPWPDRQE